MSRPGELEQGAPGTRSVLIMLTVPSHWPRMSVAEIERALRLRKDEILLALAHEVKRWGLSSAVQLGPLRKLLEEREALGQEESRG